MGSYSLQAMDAPLKKQRVSTLEAKNSDTWTTIDDFQEDLLPCLDDADLPSLDLDSSKSPVNLYASPRPIATLESCASIGINSEKRRFVVYEHKKDENPVCVQALISSTGVNQEPHLEILAVDKAIAEDLVCSECKIKFCGLQALKKHILATHTQLRPYQCDKASCGYKMATASHFIKHMKANHNLPAKTKLSLEIQKQISATLKPFLSAFKFQCAICDDLFPTQMSAQRHRSCHIHE